MQSFLNSTEEQITSTHMHKLQVSFHGRATGNITTESQDDCATVCMRRCAIPQSYHKSRTSKRKRMTKGHPNKKSHTAAFFWTSQNIFKGIPSSDRCNRRMLDKTRENAEFRVSFVLIWQQDTHLSAIPQVNPAKAANLQHRTVLDISEQDKTTLLCGTSGRSNVFLPALSITMQFN